jgi:hypothetical protein
MRLAWCSVCKYTALTQGLPHAVPLTWEYQVKLYKPEIFTLPVYEDPKQPMTWNTGWIANSDWTNAVLTATHSLNTAMSNLVFQFYISIDGTDANAIRIDSFSDTRSTGQFYGGSVSQVDSNSIQFQTGLNGLTFISSGGTSITLTTQSWFYKVVIYKPEALTASEKYIGKKETAWTTPAGPLWTGQAFTIQHNFDKHINDLTFAIYVKDDTGKIRKALDSGDAINTGGGWEEVDSNNLTYRTGSVGGPILRESDGTTISLTNQAWEYKLVVIKPESLSIYNPTLFYDSGVVTPADVTNIEYTITHGLNEEFENLIIEGVQITPQYGTQPLFVGDSGTYGVVVSKIEGNNNSFTLRFGSSGPLTLDAAGSWRPALAGWSYHIKVYKPNLLTEKMKPVSGADTVMSASMTFQVDEFTSDAYIEMINMTEGQILTLEAVGTPGPRNQVRVFNGGVNRQNVYDSVNDITYWLEGGQGVTFHFRGGGLKWASSGWETVYTTLSPGINVPEASLNRLVDDNNALYVIEGSTSTPSYHSLSLRTNGSTSRADTANASVDVRCAWNITSGRAFVSTNYTISKIRLWHNGE